MPPRFNRWVWATSTALCWATQSGTGQGDAKAEKDGKPYKISGTATGVDMANPLQPVNKPFEIAVVCP